MEYTCRKLVTCHYYLFIHRKQKEFSKLEAIQLDEEVERIHNESQTKLQVQVCTCTCTCTSTGMYMYMYCTCTSTGMYMYCT